MLKALEVVIALSFLILIHELGHFFWAKLFHIRVDKFFLFFDAGGIKLFSTRSKWFISLFPGAQSWETEYGIGWLPLGGYCKISGMVDESMDTEYLKHDPKEWEFRSKGPWKRFMVMAGGVINNFIFAFAAYILIAFVWGEVFYPNKGNKIYAGALAQEMGFRTGDEILRYDNYEPEGFFDLQADLARRDVRMAYVLRGTDTVALYIDRAMISKVIETPMMFEVAVPFAVDSVIAGSPNSSLAHGDVIMSVGGMRTPYIQDGRKALALCAGNTVDAVIGRGADSLSLPVVVDTSGRIGVFLMAPQAELKRYSLAEAVPAGFRICWENITGYCRDLKMLATPATGAYKQVGSFIAIGQVFPSVWNWHQFLYILGLLSIMLGVMNMLPIPGLDGGHMLFTIYEIVTGRKPGDKFLQLAQLIGMALLVALMLFACGNDISKFILH